MSYICTTVLQSISQLELMENTPTMLQAARELTPLVKAAAEAAALAEQAWLFRAYTAAEGAAAGKILAARERGRKRGGQKETRPVVKILKLPLLRVLYAVLANPG